MSFKLSRDHLIIGALLGLLGLFLFGLGSALTPLLIGFFMAYLFFPLVLRFEQWGLQRSHVVLLLFSGIIALSALFVLLVGPLMVHETKRFLNEAPEISARFLDKTQKLLATYDSPFSLNEQALRNALLEHSKEISQTLLKGASGFARRFVGGTVETLLSLLNFFLIPIFFVYILNDYEKIGSHLKSLIPLPIKGSFDRYIQRTDSVLSGYIRGQILVALTLSLIYGLGLSLMGLQFGFLIGFLAGGLSLIPYVGFTLGFATSLIVELAHEASGGSFLGILAIFLCGYLVESFLLTPKLVGDKLGLNALSTMLALIIGGNILGLTGMLIAIPAAAVLKTVLTDLHHEYRRLSLYRGRPS